MALLAPFGSSAGAHAEDAGSVNTCVAFEHSAYSVQEGSAAVLTLLLRHELDIAVTVTLRHRDADTPGSHGMTATAGTDFDGGDYSVTFTAGETAKTLSINTMLNPAPGDKTFQVILHDTAENRVSICEPWLATVTIREAPVVWVTGRPPLSPWFEGASLTFGVYAWPVPTRALRVPVVITDDPGSSDFLRPAAGSCPDIPKDWHDCVFREGTRYVTLQPGVHSAQFTVRTVRDSVDEPDGHVTATVQTGGMWEVHATKGSRSQQVHDDDGPSGFSSAMTLGAPDRTTLAEGPRPSRKAPGGCASANSLDNAAVMSLSTTGSYRQGLVRLLVDLGGTADYGDDYVIEIGDPDGSVHWYRADRYGRETDGAAGKGRVGWVVMDPANCLRIVALADRADDTPETVTLQVAQWDTTIGFHPAAHVDLSANTTHTFTIGTDRAAVNTPPGDPGGPGDGLDPPSGTEPEPSGDSAHDSSGLDPHSDAAPEVRYAAMIEWIRADRVADHDDHTKHTIWKRVLKALRDPAYSDYPQPAITAAQAQARYENSPWRASWPNRGWDNTWDELWHAIAYAHNWTPPDNAQQPPTDSTPQQQHTGDNSQQQQPADADNDPPTPAGNADTLTVAASAGTVGRPGVPLRFTVTASDTAQQDVTVSYTLAARGVSPYLDYCLAPAGASPVGFRCSSLPYNAAQPTGTATITTGTRTAHIAVVIDPNAWIRGSAQIDLTLTAVTGANTITTPTATGNIQR